MGDWSRGETWSAALALCMSTEPGPVAEVSGIAADGSGRALLGGHPVYGLPGTAFRNGDLGRSLLVITRGQIKVSASALFWPCWRPATYRANGHQELTARCRRRCPDALRRLVLHQRDFIETSFPSSIEGLA